MKWFSAIALAVLAGVGSATSVLDVLSGPEFGTLRTLLKASGLAKTLQGPGPLTVFAPTDAAFSQPPMSAYKIAYLTDPANVETLKAVLSYHVSASNTTFDGVVSAGSKRLPTVLGSADSLFLIYNLDGKKDVTVQDGTCGSADVARANFTAASNGGVFAINAVFMPPGRVCPDSFVFAEQRGQQRVVMTGFDCRNSGQRLLSTSEEKPVGTAADSAAGFVFWSNDQNQSPYDSWLTRSSLTGADSTILFNAQLYDPQGLDADPVSRRLFFTERQGSMVSSSNYDGSDRKLVLQLNATQFPADVAVDGAADALFALVTGPEDVDGELWRVPRAGGKPTVYRTGLNKAYGVCVDTRNQHVYFVQGGHGGGLYCLPYGATPCKTKDPAGVVVDGLDYPYMCTVDSTWTPYGGPAQIILSSTSGSITIVTDSGDVIGNPVSGLDAPMGVAHTCAGEPL